MSVAVGFQYLVCGGGSSKWTMLSLFCSVFSLFTFVVSIAYISFLAAKNDYDFIPSDFSTSKKEVKN